MRPIKKPEKISPVFSDERFQELKSLFHNREKTFKYDAGFSRYWIDNLKMPELTKFSEELLPLARKHFNNDSIKPTFTYFAHYCGPNANVKKHVDINACAYSLDFCIDHLTPWDIWVEGVPYKLQPNEALAFYGENQEHWREEFPDKEKNFVSMLFFFYAEPDHWFFTKGPEYVQILLFKQQIEKHRQLKMKNNK